MTQEELDAKVAAARKVLEYTIKNSVMWADKYRGILEVIDLQTAEITRLREHELSDRDCELITAGLYLLECRSDAGELRCDMVSDFKRAGGLPAEGEPRKLWGRLNRLRELVAGE